MTMKIMMIMMTTLISPTDNSKSHRLISHLSNEPKNNRFEVNFNRFYSYASHMTLCFEYTY